MSDGILNAVNLDLIYSVVIVIAFIVGAKLINYILKRLLALTERTPTKFDNIIDSKCQSTHLRGPNSRRIQFSFKQDNAAPDLFGSSELGLLRCLGITWRTYYH